MLVSMSGCGADVGGRFWSKASGSQVWTKLTVGHCAVWISFWEGRLNSCLPLPLEQGQNRGSPPA